jgi:hypothetical protein
LSDLKRTPKAEKTMEDSGFLDTVARLEHFGDRK